MLLGGEKDAQASGQDVPDESVKRKYEYFRSLLIKNNRSLELLTDFERLVYENKPFTLDQVLSLSEDLISLVYDLAEDLNALSHGRYPGLFDATERIGVTVLKDLAHRRRVRKGGLVIPLRELSADMWPSTTPAASRSLKSLLTNARKASLLSFHRLFGFTKPSASPCGES